MYTDIKDLYFRKGHKFFEKRWSLNVFGMRVANPKSDSNSFEDKIGVAFLDDNKIPNALVFDGCTIPAIKYLKNPINPEGCAVLKCGQYRGSHQIGLHKGRIALVQTGAPVTVWRDTNKDGIVDIGGKEETGYFGINIHDGKNRGWSAGCQIAQAEDIAILYYMARKSAAIYGNSFTYTLF